MDSSTPCAPSIDASSSGELIVGGELLRRPLTDVGIVFQDHLLLEFRSALDNVLLQAQIRRLPLADFVVGALEDTAATRIVEDFELALTIRTAGQGDRRHLGRWPPVVSA